MARDCGALADTVAVFFINPFVITALSPWVLGERVGVWRWSAVATGFLGTMILVRPGFETIEAGHLYAIGAGTAFALFALVTRRLAGGDPPLVTAFLTGAGTLLRAKAAIASNSPTSLPLSCSAVNTFAVFAVISVMSFALVAL